MATDLPNSIQLPQWSPPTVRPFEERLDSDLEYAVTQGSIFFNDRGDVQETLKRVTSRLDEARIPYAVCGGMALFRHGFRRFTEDVDILVTRESLIQIHELLEGRGFVRPFENSKNLRDTATGVRVEFLIAGQFPGDGKPKAVAFPDPLEAADAAFDVKVLNIQWLVTLKLASGLTGQNREKDLVDVSALIEAKELPLTLADSLPDLVRDKYVELWNKYDSAKPGFMKQYRVESVEGIDGNWNSFRRAFPDQLEQSHSMENAGVKLELRILDKQRGLFVLTTRDPDVAAKFKMTPENEYFSP